MLVAVGAIVFAHILKIYTKRTHHEAPNRELRHTHSRSVSSSHPDLSSLKRTFTAQLPPILQNRISRIRLVRGLAYALISGILSAHSLLVAKTAVELLVRTIVDHNNQFNSYQSWLIILALVFFALTQLYYLHLGLRLCSTSVLYPFVFCIYNIIAILDGLIYFRQGSRLSTLHASLIAVGTVILLTGVLALSWRLDDSSPTDPPVPQSTEPENFNPLTPGMGLMCSGEDSPRSPLLPTVRPRISASASRHSVNEQTPLLYHRLRRTPTLNIYPPPPDPGTNNIWAELDDEGNESDHDILASLPRTPSPFLTHNHPPARRRSRGASLSFVTTPNSNTNSLILPRKRSSAGSADSARYRGAKQVQAWQPENIDKQRRQSSAPVWTSGNGSLVRTPISKSTPNLLETSEAANGSAAVATTAHEDPRGEEHGESETNDNARNFNATVSGDAPVPLSRWDASWSRWWRGEPDKNAGDKDPGG
jgi:Magnesium transporter NIPA